MFGRLFSDMEECLYYIKFKNQDIKEVQIELINFYESIYIYIISILKKVNYGYF